MWCCLLFLLYFLYFLYFFDLVHFSMLSLCIPLFSVIFFFSLFMLSPCYILFFPLRVHFPSCVLGNIFVVSFLKPTAIFSCYCVYITQSLAAQLAFSVTAGIFRDSWHLIPPPPLFLCSFFYSAVIFLCIAGIDSFLVFEEAERVIICNMK